jgi:hypothetical protein
MSRTHDQSPLEALLDSWDRNNTILLNLLRAVPEGGWPAQARFWLEWGSSTAGQSLPAALFVFSCRLFRVDLHRPNTRSLHSADLRFAMISSGRDDRVGEI